jgi:hypothetical protein
MKLFSIRRRWIMKQREALFVFDFGISYAFLIIFSFFVVAGKKSVVERWRILEVVMVVVLRKR